MCTAVTQEQQKTDSGDNEDKPTQSYKEWGKRTD